MLNSIELLSAAVPENGQGCPTDMWLVNANDHLLEEFIPEQCPPYAILSHRWEKEEVSFNDMKDLSHAREKQGFFKILMTCQFAIKNNLTYAWIDTCCINRESSAELSEAINSMFRWYRDAKYCFVYLSDVHHSRIRFKEFAQSAWFTRGWTLQELIAPKDLTFYSSSWKFIGTKLKLAHLLEKITGVSRVVLKKKIDLSHIPVVTKMAWASYRQTTRREDVAYCLLGIFDVNMPLLYGEGDKAFQRLQEEIIRRSDDGTIFAWRPTQPGYTGLLAESPSQFAETAPDHADMRTNSEEQIPRDITLTNKGIQLTVYALLRSPELYQVLTGCYDTVTKRHVPIYLQRRIHNSHEHCTRIHFSEIDDQTPMLGDRWYDISLDRPPPQIPGESTIVHLRVLVSESHQSTIPPAITDRRFSMDVQIMGKSLFPRVVTRGGRVSDLSPDLSCMFPIYEYGILLKLLSDHPILESLLLGFNFDGFPFLFATTRTISPKRCQIIRSLITGDPGQDSDWALAHSDRSNELSRRIWQKQSKLMPELDRRHAMTLKSAQFYPLRSSPTQEGLWVFRGSPHAQQHFGIGFPGDELNVNCVIGPTESAGGRYKVIINVR